MSERIRVLVAIGSMAGGGSERQTVNLLQHLDRSRFSPCLYLVYRSGELLPEIPSDVPVFAFSDDAETPRINWPGRIHAQRVRHLVRVLRQENIQVVYDRTLTMALQTGPATRKLGVPRLSVVVADPVRDFPDQAGAFRSVKRRMLKAAYRDAYRVVALSEDLRQSVVRYYGLQPDRVVVSANGIDLERVDDRAANVPAPFQRDRFHIISAGRLQQQKGFEFLIQAMNVLVHQRDRGDVMLHILGQGPLESTLKQMVLDLRLGSQVQFHGFQVNPLGYYRQAQLFCLASLFEGTPNVLMEAMACRVPVISTDCISGPRELLRDGEFGALIPPGDSVALADAIQHAADHYDDCTARIDAARDWLEEGFSVAAATRRTEALLDQAANSQES